MTGVRIAAALAGVALLCATAHVTIEQTGGYGTPHALLTMAIAYGIGIGALCIGVAWSGRRKALAGWLVAAILAGEAFELLSVAKKVIVVDAAAREADQAQAEFSRGLQAIEHGLLAARGMLADRVGAPAWLITLLSSMAANGLGCGLLAYGALERRHGKH